MKWTFIFISCTCTQSWVSTYLEWNGTDRVNNQKIFIVVVNNQNWFSLVESYNDPSWIKKSSIFFNFSLDRFGSTWITKWLAQMETRVQSGPIHVSGNPAYFPIFRCFHKSKENLPDSIRICRFDTMTQWFLIMIPPVEVCHDLNTLTLCHLSTISWPNFSQLTSWTSWIFEDFVWSLFSFLVIGKYMMQSYAILT